MATGRRIAVIVTGDRHATNKEQTSAEVRMAWGREVLSRLGALSGDGKGIDRVVVLHGDAPGIDRIAHQGNHWWPYCFLPMPADWDGAGKAAGPVRNAKMLTVLLALRDSGYEVHCLGFHNDWTRSKGTKNMVQRAAAVGVKTTVITSEGGIAAQWNGDRAVTP